MKQENKEINLRDLAKKFPEEDIEWRVMQTSLGANGMPWVLLAPYITNRAIQQRLDDVCGLGMWENDYKLSPCGKGYLCGIRILIGDKWVTRWDGAEFGDSTSIDNVKTASSNSMKRAGVQWGIGRYLYQFESEFGDCILCDNRRDCPDTYTYQLAKDKKTNVSFGMAWRPSKLADWALPVTPNDVKAIVKKIFEAETMEDLKEKWKLGYRTATAELDDAMMKTFEKAKESAKLRLLQEEEDEQQRISDDAEKFVIESIEVIESSLNESTVDGQMRLAISKASSIKNETVQREAILKIKAASKKVIEQLTQNRKGK